MKTHTFTLICLVSFSLFFIGCKNDDDNVRPSISVNDFVWKAMNLWYYWQEQSPKLADDAFPTANAYQQFIQAQSTQDLFYGLLYDRGQTDRFSWIVEDYHALDQQFAGINKSFGMNYGLVYESAQSDKIFGYVRYVLPHSSADLAGMHRGQIFSRINGVQLTASNYVSLLSQNTANFGMAILQNGHLQDLNLNISLSQTEIQENPIHLAKVLDFGTQKVGYLLYNGFRANFNDELNETIGYFRSQDITDLVIDLRYNGGGTVQTAAYLGSMITGQFNEQDFTRLYFNQKAANNNSVYTFTNKGKTYDDDLNENGHVNFNHLFLNRLFILTSNQTASASEMLISCMNAYINVNVFGQKTYGKTVGSITLYDSPNKGYTSSEAANPNHTWAMQPIVFEYKNVLDQSSPSQGIEPLQNINELHYLEHLPPLGSLEDPLLAAALQQIVPNASKTTSVPMNTHLKAVEISEKLQRFSTEMYLDKGFDFNP
ncbi:MAG TPA: S41 family peptidase [Moheibacter sp.]|nr:S41 family peptidase [Moheibacter sp.]